MKYLTFVGSLLLLTGCVHSTLGYGEKTENGVSTESYETCMANCLERSENGERCVTFSSGMADVCKEFRDG